MKQQLPATDSTIYSVGSLTKPFTAAAIVLLSQQGKLKLDDPVTQYLPEGKKVWSGVTIRHLLTHTSGVPQDTTLDYSRDYTEAQLVGSAAQPLLFTPGAMESYSSTGYSLLGIIIHRVTGQFWGDFVRQQIFQPLGMRTARVNSDADNVPNRASRLLPRERHTPEPRSRCRPRSTAWPTAASASPCVTWPSWPSGSTMRSCWAGRTEAELDPGPAQQRRDLPLRPGLEPPRATRLPADRTQRRLARLPRDLPALSRLRPDRHRSVEPGSGKFRGHRDRPRGIGRAGLTLPHLLPSRSPSNPPTPVNRVLQALA